MSVDFGRGTSKDYESDLMEVAKGLTITMGAATEVPGFGVELTGGSGTIGMTIGDTAVFETRPVNSGSMSVEIGSRSDEFAEFGAILSAEKKSGEIFVIDVYRAKAIGMPFGFEEKAYGEYEQSIEVIYDREKDALCKIEEVVAA